jgi:excisionase family DNA binding protein
MNAPQRLRAGERIYTPLEVARLINVHVKSVANWIRQGMLESYRTPGGHNRITRTGLLRFLNERNMPIPDELGDGRLHILVVDDDPAVAGVVAAALRDQGDAYQVETVQSGIEALMEIGKHTPDLVILDIFMPELDGFEVCRRIKGSPERKHLRILSVSGDHDPAVRQKILDCGADSFLLKPIDLSDLRQQIESLIRR